MSNATAPKGAITLHVAGSQLIVNSTRPLVLWTDFWKSKVPLSAPRAR